MKVYMKMSQLFFLNVCLTEYLNEKYCKIEKLLDSGELLFPLKLKYVIEVLASTFRASFSILKPLELVKNTDGMM